MINSPKTLARAYTHAHRYLKKEIKNKGHPT